VVGAKAGVVSFALGKVYLDRQAVEVSETHSPHSDGRFVLTDQPGREGHDKCSRCPELEDDPHHGVSGSAFILDVAI
jgi:hypothetical protein